MAVGPHPSPTSPGARSRPRTSATRVLALWTELLERLPTSRSPAQFTPAEVAPAVALPVPEEPMPVDDLVAHLRS